MHRSRDHYGPAVNHSYRVLLGGDKHDNQEVLDQPQGTSPDAVYLKVVSHQSCFSLALLCHETKNKLSHITDS